MIIDRAFLSGSYAAEALVLHVLLNLHRRPHDAVRRADVNLKSKDGSTALTLAIEREGFGENLHWRQACTDQPHESIGEV